jgi:hypothetical protein
MPTECHKQKHDLGPVPTEEIHAQWTHAILTITLHAQLINNSRIVCAVLKTMALAPDKRGQFLTKESAEFVCGAKIKPG